MADSIVLLDRWPSVFAMRVRIALAEKELEFECKEQDLSNKSAELLRMNPIHKKVPVLVHNGRSICESLVIMEYIDDVWKGGRPLLPQDPYSRAQARFWASFIDQKMASAGRKLWTTEGGEHDKGRTELIESLKLLEGVLGEEEYFGAGELGYLDIALLGFAPWFKVYENYGHFRLDDECPRLSSWAKRCSSRPSAVKWLAQETEILEVVHGRFGPPK